MDDSCDLNAIWDSMNINGQWQPSGSTPPVDDDSLAISILDDVSFGSDEILSTPSLPILNNNDDILNALINTPESSEIGNLFATSLGELPRQSTIEETMENMTLNHPQTDGLSSAICVQMGSSPVEQKEIENSILVNQYVHTQRRMMKNISKSKRKSASHPSSSSVGPVDVLSSHGACQPCTTVQMQSDFDYAQQLSQFDSMESKKIQIICHPRLNFRPRTQNESKNASHYLRCDANSQFEYPTIYLYPEWARQSVRNIIAVTLVGKDGQPHAYTIDNKTCKPALDDDALIFRQNEPHTMYFCLTPEDFTNGFKSFMIEYIKSKQDTTITKDLIKNRQLEQSMLRFTRFFQGAKNDFQRDENSVEYSTVMTEAYGDVAVEHLTPRYGPVSGNEHVHVLLKGRIGKDDITVVVSNDEIGWRHRVSLTKNGNLVYFLMPAFPFPQCEKALANITVYYKDEELFQSVYLYKGSLDQELAALNLSDSSPPPPLPTFNAYDFFATSGVCPVPQSTKKSSKNKRPKRLGPSK